MRNRAVIGKFFLRILQSQRDRDTVLREHRVSFYCRPYPDVLLRDVPFEALYWILLLRGMVPRFR